MASRVDMSVTAIVPMRHTSERVPGKNYRLLGGRPLYHHVIEALLASETVGIVVIDTDSPVVLDDAARHFPDVTPASSDPIICAMGASL